LAPKFRIGATHPDKLRLCVDRSLAPSYRGEVFRLDVPSSDRAHVSRPIGAIARLHVAMRLEEVRQIVRRGVSLPDSVDQPLLLRRKVAELRVKEAGAFVGAVRD
jgi:hypothetical protein